jgi:serine/threonine protein kinase
MADSDPPTLPPKNERQTLPAAGGPGARPLPEQFGRYRIEKHLGQGGMGAVYLAHDTQLGRPVALKVPFLAGPSPDAVRARFLREAQAAAALLHPNICPIHDLGEIDGVPFLTMAFIRGEPLARRLDPARPLPPRDAAALARKLALALHEAHACGVIHRDLKPANVMIDERGEPVLMDFGLARRDDSLLNLTREGEVLGTPVYMPPEQVTGDVRAMGPASDVYSLGVLLYELLTGTVPFQGDLVALMSQITLDPPPPPSSRRPGLDPCLDALCLRALAKQPAERWPSMRAFADALGAFLDAHPPPGAGGRPAAGAGPLPLTLRVEGTPFAYRPLPGQQVVTLGRQRRKPGDPPDHGNDVVLRVPGNDALSARISRRHLEVRRDGDGFVVVDHSKGGTAHNGRPLTRDVPAPLAAGDRLVVAGVLTLAVLLDAAPRARPTRAEVEVAQTADRVVLEATVGDMVTLD